MNVRSWMIGLLLLVMGLNDVNAQYSSVRVGNLNYWYYDSGAWVVENSKEGYVAYPYPESVYNIPESITVNGKVIKVEAIFASAFSGSQVRHVTLPSTLETIESSAFNNSYLSEISIPKSVKTIRSYAFANTDLTQLEIPASVTLIDNNIVNGCQKLRNIFVDKENKNYKDTDGVLCTADGTLKQFPGARKGTYVTPSSVREIDAYGLWNIEHLDTLVLSEGIGYISYYAFYKSSLSMLVMGSTVKHIQSMPMFKTDGNASFYCFATTPPRASFWSETLNEVILYVPHGCKEAYQDGQMWKLFKGIKEMDAGMTIDKLNIQYNGPTYGDFPMEHTQVFVIRKDDVYYNLYPQTGEAKVQPDRPRDYYDGHYSKERYDIPASVTTVDNRKYRVTEIVDAAFYASNVRQLTLPEGLIRIGRSAFYDTRLEVVDIPSTVKEIGGYAFGGKTPVKKIICQATVPPTCEDIIIDTQKENVTLYVPEKAVESYRQAPVWSDFKDIRAIGSTGITPVLDSDGKLSGLYYDLQGRRLTGKPDKGLYIQNGKKVMVK